jgi:putative membrane protein
MMKMPFLCSIALLALVSSASAQSAGEKTGVNSTLGIAPKTEDFVKEAAMSDMTEIAASKIGQERGNADEKAFSAQMVKDHTKTSTQLKALLTSAKISAPLPNGLDSSNEGKVAKLRDAKPESFSSEFDSMQVSAHKDAVSLFERYAKGGENPKLKEWANKTLPALRHHLEMAQNLEKKRK